MNLLYKQTNSIRILFVLNNLGLGGAERQLLTLATALNNAPFEVVVGYYDNRDLRLIGDYQAAGVKVVDLKRNHLGRIPYIYSTAYFLWRNQVDVVQAFSASANIYARLPAVLSGVPVIFGSMRGKKHFVSKYMALACSLTNLFTTGWILNSYDLVPILFRSLYFLNGLKIWVIQNGFEPVDNIDYRYFELTVYDTIKSRKMVVAAIGRLVPVKNHEMFLEAAKQVLEDRNDVEFWLIGDGPLLERHNSWVEEQGLRENIKLLGHRDDIDIALARIDLLVHTSLSEGCPNVIIEAMRAGKPVISTKSTDLSNIIDEGKNGFQILCEDTETLVERINKILNLSEAQRTMMGQISRDLFNSHFLIYHSAACFLEAYKEALIRASSSKPRLNEKLKSIGLQH